MANRLRGRYGYPEDDPFRVMFHPDRLSEPRRWRKPRRVFVCSMGDFFHKDVQYEWQCAVLDEIQCNPKHTFQILTKRADRQADFFKHQQSLPVKMLGMELPPANLWIGVTAENREQMIYRVSHLMYTPIHPMGGVRFISFEPLLENVGPIEDAAGDDWWESGQQPMWVIIGCETGPGARPCDIQWVRSIVGQCKAAGVACFVKQLQINGKVSKNMNEWPEDLRVREYPK